MLDTWRFGAILEHEKSPETVEFQGFLIGSPSWTRTNDPAVNSRMLYRLSY